MAEKQSISECFASEMSLNEKVWNTFRKSNRSSWRRFSSVIRVMPIRGVMGKEGMLEVYQINTFLYTVLQQAQVALQQQDIQRFVCDAAEASRHDGVAERPTATLLLSALPFNRQLKRLQASAKEQAFFVWKMLCLPLKQFPSSGRLVLNQQTDEPELNRRLKNLAAELGPVELRILRGYPYLVLYLFNGREVCLLRLLDASLFNEAFLNGYFS
ncbi:hypothetical protein [Hafnia alvei]|uniref:Uncharacterized protein n=1 Tax=Hafnia alvei TaxID=569 RepID=A0A1C6Z041_HAFAL|nr:hypothetical protein [Hafnia alvei]SCM52345.1 hypothetical protein BN1044_01828 [Hafnia alvei]